MKLNERILSLFLAILLSFSLITPAMANDSITVKIDGQQVTFDVQPQLINNRTMVPLRAIFEALGATVDWNNDTRTVTSVKGDTTISLTINNATMYVNDKTVTLDTPACIVGGRTLVPVRAISEAFGTKVDWIGITKTVIISTPDKTTTTMFAPDGRTMEVDSSKVEENKAVGWYLHPVVRMYAADGRTLVVKAEEVEAYKKVGWYTEPMTTMYARDGRTLVLPVSKVEAHKKVGWYTKAEYDAYYYYPNNGISENVPKFNVAVGGALISQEDDVILGSKKSLSYTYKADFEKAQAYQELLEKLGWERGRTKFNYDTEIVNNQVKEYARSFSLWFEKGKVSLYFQYSYKTNNVILYYYE